MISNHSEEPLGASVALLGVATAPVKRPSDFVSTRLVVAVRVVITWVVSYSASVETSVPTSTAPYYPCVFKPQYQTAVNSMGSFRPVAGNLRLHRY